MLEDIHFSYDGVNSTEFGLLNVKLDGGMFDETFLPTRSINETSTSGNERPYFTSVSNSPLSFSLSFAFEHYYDDVKIREVARWLMKDYYKPFYMLNNPDRIFYCMVDGDSRLVHNGLKQGYLSLNMRCDSPYSYSPKFVVENKEFTSTKLEKSLLVNTFNSGDGYFENTSTNASHNLVLDKVEKITWRQLSGMKWSDL